MASPRPGRPARNLYQLLGVPREASQADITRAYRRQARAMHPDSRPQGAAAPARFRAVAEAYQVLSDPARRADYDRALPGRPAPDPDPVARPDTSTGTMVPVPWQAPPAWPDQMTAPARRPGPALWAGPVRVEPPGTRPSRGAQRAEHASLTVRAELTGSYLGDGRDRP
jgi:curved DNA-binding protein CbpA